MQDSSRHFSMSSDKQVSNGFCSDSIKNMECIGRCFFLGGALNSFTNFPNARRRVERFGSDRQFMFLCCFLVSSSSSFGGFVDKDAIADKKNLKCSNG